MKMYMQALIAPLLLVSYAMSMERVAPIATNSTFDEQVIPAAGAGRIGRLRSLVELDANINVRDNEYGATALHWAIGSKDRDMTDEKRLATVQFLLNETEIDVNLTNKSGSTPLVYAIFLKRTKIAEELIKHDKTDVNIANDLGNTAIIHAQITAKSQTLYELLLKRRGEKTEAYQSPMIVPRKQTDQFMSNGFEPYHELSVSISHETHDASLARAHDIVKNGEDYVGRARAAFSLAISQGNIDIVKLLIEAGIQVNYRVLYGGVLFVSQSPVELAKNYDNAELTTFLSAWDQSNTERAIETL